ncbi:MAG TPA: putative maltokinase [Candidatus Acidoferrum sp.]|jgi:maltose alpha-D-glucosyltransferase/alpha-amylase
MAAPSSRKELLSTLKTELPSQLPAYLKSQRWFGGKARELHGTEVVDIVSLPRPGINALVLLLKVQYQGGGEDLYSVPLLYDEAAGASEGSANKDGAARLAVSGHKGSAQIVFSDALKDEHFLAFLLDAIRKGLVFTGEAGELRTTHTHALSLQETGAAGSLHPRAIKAEQSNSSIAYGERLILKFFRRLEEGINPDLEMTSFLTEKAGYQHTPQLLGALEYITGSGRRMTQGILQTFVANQGDAWQYTMKCISRFYHEVADISPDGSPADGSSVPAPRDLALASQREFLESAALLGRRTAELHLALASGPAAEDPDFAPEPFDATFQEGLEQALMDLTGRIFTQLRKSKEELHESLQSKAEEILCGQDKITQRFHTALSAPIQAQRTRIHGDYHLGQVLYTGTDFVIIDFEGEPARPMSQRRLKRSPLQDVAGMLRSFHYAAYGPLLASTGTVNVDEKKKQNLNDWAEVWAKWVGDRYLEEYLKTATGAAFLPPTREEITALLQLYVLEKAVYELGYELNNRPEWVAIPLEGISKMLLAATP